MCAPLSRHSLTNDHNLWRLNTNSRMFDERNSEPGVIVEPSEFFKTVVKSKLDASKILSLLCSAASFDKLNRNGGWLIWDGLC